MKHNKLKLLTLWAFALIITTTSFAQNDTTVFNALQKEIKELKQEVKDYRHRFDILEKKIDDNTWFLRDRKSTRLNSSHL